MLHTVVGGDPADPQVFDVVLTQIVQKALAVRCVSLKGRVTRSVRVLTLADDDRECRKLKILVEVCAVGRVSPSALRSPRLPYGRRHLGVAKGSMFRGWGGEVDGHENATLNQHRETAAGETDADEIEQDSPCLARR